MQVKHVKRPIDNFVQVFISTHNNYCQVALASIYLCISVHWASRNFFEALHVAQFPLHTWRQLRFYLWAMEEREANFNGKLHSICLTSCEAWRYQTFGEGTWTATSPHDTAKGVACKTRSEPLPSPVSLAVGSIPRAKRTCLLALLNVRKATSPCLRFCCTNNRIIIFYFYVYEWIRVRKLTSFAGKGVYTNGCLRRFVDFSHIGNASKVWH